MRRFPTTIVIVAVAIVGLVAGWFVFAPIETQRYREVAVVRNQASVIRLDETKTYAKGPIAREELLLTNDNGKSLAFYSIEDRKGTIAKFNEPIDGYDVTFAFDLLVRDGIWDLHTPRVFHGKTDVIYTIAIDQRAGDKHGSHRFNFADPHWLATAAGNEYEIHLDKNKPVPTQDQLLKLQSTSIADSRYQKVVDDFASFGPPRFKKTIAAARAKLLRS